MHPPFKPNVGCIQSLLIPDIEKFINLGPDCLVRRIEKYSYKKVLFDFHISPDEIRILK